VPSKPYNFKLFKDVAQQTTCGSTLATLTNVRTLVTPIWHTPRAHIRELFIWQSLVQYLQMRIRYAILLNSVIIPRFVCVHKISYAYRCSHQTVRVVARFRSSLGCDFYRATQQC